jgi:gag-polypeptide of LTR copia-type
MCINSKLAGKIWARPAQEHGAISTPRRVIANCNFYQLFKEPTTSVDTHIPIFMSCLQDLNYNSKAPLKDVDVNVTFLASLGPSWETFQQPMGEKVNTLKLAILNAKVRAFETQKGTAEQFEDKIAFALH